MSVRWILLGLSYDVVRICPSRAIDGYSTKIRRGTRKTQYLTVSLQSSELCATCHTLYTKALGPEGEVVGELPEQVPFLEWQHSDYREERNCQSCHMPVVEDSSAIASVLGAASARCLAPRFSRRQFLHAAHVESLPRRIRC